MASFNIWSLISSWNSSLTLSSTFIQMIILAPCTPASHFNTHLYCTRYNLPVNSSVCSQFTCLQSIYLSAVNSSVCTQFIYVCSQFPCLQSVFLCLQSILLSAVTSPVCSHFSLWSHYKRGTAISNGIIYFTLKLKIFFLAGRIFWGSKY